MKAIDLFGQLSTVPEKPGPETKLKRWAAFAHYRRAEPGNPNRCKRCQHAFMKRYSRHYWKCDMLGDSNCISTDIRANHTCKFFEPCDPGPGN